MDPRRAESQRSWGRLGAGQKLGRILGSGEKGYRRTFYGVVFTLAMAEGEANCEAGEDPEDRLGRGAGAWGVHNSRASSVRPHSRACQPGL